MGLIVTPRELEQRAELYHQLGSLLSAGVPILQGLEILARNPPSRALRGPLQRLHLHIEAGETFVGAMRQSGHDLPVFDVALLEAGEQSGRLDACFRLLSQYYRDRAQMARRVISYLVYPVLTLHVAVLVFPVTLLTAAVLKGEIIPFLVEKVLVLGPLYGVVFLFLYFSQTRRGPAMRSLVEAVLHPVPVLGAARRDLALARLATALEATSMRV